MLFQLKGLPLKEAKSDGLKLLKLLDLQQKKNELVNTLSGGMKRKVSLAIALIGNPEVRKTIIIIYASNALIVKNNLSNLYIDIDFR